MPITKETLENYSSKALKNMFGEDNPPASSAPPPKPSAMKYTKDFFLGNKGKAAKKVKKKKKKGNK